jgi:hypothetical protein
MPFLLVFLALEATGANVTKEVLQAKLVKNFVRIRPLPNSDSKTAADEPVILHYATDSFDELDFKPLNGVAFRVDDPVLLLLARHNPLLEVYTIDRTRTPDPNHEALKALFDELTTLQKSLGDPNGAGGGGDEIGARITKVRELIVDPHEEEACLEFLDLVETARKALQEKEVDPKIFADRVKKTIGFKGVTDFRTTVEGFRTTIAKNNATARDNLKKITEIFGNVPGVKPKKVCSLISSQILVNYTELTSTAAQIIARKEELSRQLLAIHKSLDPYVIEAKWRGPVDPGTGQAVLIDYLATSLNPTDEEQEDVKVSVKTKTVEFDAATESIKTAESKDPLATSQFAVRIDSLFTVERAAAMVYNTLEYPQYGTAKNAAGETIVERTKDQEPIDAALMFNFIPRLRFNSRVYPMFQIGVSSAKDFPGLLAGLGFRVVGRYPISLSAGGMITRYKDLDDTLKRGQVVRGTDEINKHLKLQTSDVALYGAIQLKF